MNCYLYGRINVRLRVLALCCCTLLITVSCKERRSSENSSSHATLSNDFKRYLAENELVKFYVNYSKAKELARVKNEFNASRSIVTVLSSSVVKNFQDDPWLHATMIRDISELYIEIGDRQAAIDSITQIPSTPLRYYIMSTMLDWEYIGDRMKVVEEIASLLFHGIIVNGSGEDVCPSSSIILRLAQYYSKRNMVAELVQIVDSVPFGSDLQRKILSFSPTAVSNTLKNVPNEAGIVGRADGIASFQEQEAQLEMTLQGFLDEKWKSPKGYSGVMGNIASVNPGGTINMASYQNTSKSRLVGIADMYASLGMVKKKQWIEKRMKMPPIEIVLKNEGKISIGDFCVVDYMRYSNFLNHFLQTAYTADKADDSVLYSRDMSRIYDYIIKTVNVKRRAFLIYKWRKIWKHADGGGRTEESSVNRTGNKPRNELLDLIDR